MAVAITLPRSTRRRGPRRLMLLGIAAAVLAVGGYELGAPRFLSSAGVVPQSLRPPTARVSVQELIAGQPLHGAVTLTSTEASTDLGPAEVVIFPAGARRAGVAEESVQTRLLTVDIGRSIGSGETRRVEFVWDLRLGDGRNAPAGDYVAIVRVRSHVTAGEAQTSAMGLSNEVTFTVP